MNGFPPITDIMKLIKEQAKDKTVNVFCSVQYKYHNCNPLPDFTAMVLLGTCYMFVNKAELLEEFYVKKNMHYSKAWADIDLLTPLFRNGPLVQRSEDP